MTPPMMQAPFGGRPRPAELRPSPTPRPSTPHWQRPTSPPPVEPSSRPRREKEPETTARVLWIKDSLCSTCNHSANTPGHVQPCTMPKVCWNCDSQGHEAEGCPHLGPRRRSLRGKPVRGNHVTPASSPHSHILPLPWSTPCLPPTVGAPCGASTPLPARPP